MNSSVSAMRVRFDDDNMWIELSDGRTLGVPLGVVSPPSSWHSRTARAGENQQSGPTLGLA